MSWNFFEYGYYPKTTPREVKGGIKAQTKRGAFGKNWWAKRWIQVLESFDIGERLSRGRSYARRGQVVSIEVEKGEVHASVQGTMRNPYKISIEVKQLSPKEWNRLLSALSSQALYTARLLSGEMPEDIESVFSKEELSLFPQKRRDLKMSCSCPDGCVPCKHLAAVFYILGEEFDRDPFLIFKLRGMTREEIVEGIGKAVEEEEDQTKVKRKGRKKREIPQALEVYEEEISPSKTALLPPVPIDSTPSVFWHGATENPHKLSSFQDKEFPPPPGEIKPPPVSAYIPKRLGNFPMWRGRDYFLDSLENIYQEASVRGMEIFMKEN